MKRRLTFAAGIIHRPPILFLDEPTTGIDVASARQIRGLISDLATGGTTIFLTTHYIEEAERLCRRIAFIVAGRIVRTDTVENLMQPLEGRRAVEFTLNGAAESLADDLRAAFPALEPQQAGPGRLRVTAAQPVSIGPLVRFFEDRGVETREARQVRPSLEDVFVEVTGIEAAAMKQEQTKMGGGA
jgi:ABC-2 type transport system ATP-binding protein